MSQPWKRIGYGHCKAMSSAIIANDLAYLHDGRPLLIPVWFSSPGNTRPSMPIIVVSVNI